MRRAWIIGIVVALLMPMRCAAQWRVGMSAGTDYNFYTIDKHYLLDYRYLGEWGFTVGVSGRYDFFPWLGLKAELNMTQKNHRMTRYVRTGMNYHYWNYYMQLPVMVNFSFGAVNDRDGNARSGKVRGFVNLGFYGGYWVASRLTGTDYNYFSHPAEIIKLHENGLNTKRDQRWDCGPVGGIGIEYKCAEHWAIQFECRYYYSLLSARKNTEHVKDPAYNSPLVLQFSFDYIF